MTAMTGPRPFKIHVPQTKIDSLKDKLAKASFPDELEDVGRDDGPPLKDIKRLVSSWQTYDWRAVEAELNNNNDQFMTNVDVDGFGTLQIHYVHQRSHNPDAIPLLFVHGWPGNFTEASKLKELLRVADAEADRTGQNSLSFHLVAPSLPNFGFSSGVSKRGFGLKQYAAVLQKLMQQLGYEHYATQAGDWGYWITRAMGHSYPESVLASHYNMVFAARPKWSTHPLLALQHLVTPYSAVEKEHLARTTWFRAESQGYNHLQSSKPQTLGYGLADSPVALLAWIYEKMCDWSDAYAWEDQEVLLWVSIYWFSVAGPAAPQRIYREVRLESDPRYTYSGMLRSTPRSVRLGLTYNPKELEMFPRTWGRTLGSVVCERMNTRGGHFYAHEHPDWLLRDLKEMFGNPTRAFRR